MNILFKQNTRDAKLIGDDARYKKNDNNNHSHNQIDDFHDLMSHAE